MRNKIKETENLQAHKKDLLEKANTILEVKLDMDVVTDFDIYDTKDFLLYDQDDIDDFNEKDDE
jgi:hypothetical protein